MRIPLLAFAIAASSLSALAADEADEVRVPAGARSALGITIYNDGQALVRDSRRLPLQAGINRLAFADVAATIRPETASLRTLSGPGFAILEQNYEFDLLSPQSLLRKYVGREVTLTRTNPATGVETAEQATVLATNDGVVLRYPDRIETEVVGRIAFGSVPATLRERPTLSMLLEAGRAGSQDAELMYLASQVGWKADYIANVGADGARMKLDGWVTLTNRSGVDFSDAKLQLVAGTLNRVREQRDMAMKAMAMPAPAAAPVEMHEEKIGDYHLYTLPRLTTVRDQQTKQVALLSAGEIPVRREYVLHNANGFWWYQGAHPEIQKGLKPSIFLHFENRGGDLGVPLPAGTIRVYMKDSSGGAQLVGEDAIGHTAKGEKIELRLGEAFDITADRTQTDFKVLDKRSSQSSFRIEVRNADKNPVTVAVREPLRGDWRISAENLPHVKESSGSARWQVAVPAEGKALLEYTAVVKW